MLRLYSTSWGESSVYAISMKYRKIILIIIIINLGKILWSYITNTSRTHACSHTHSRTRTYHPTTIAILVVAVRWVGAPNHDEVNPPLFHRHWMAGSCSIQTNSSVCDGVFAIVWVFFAYNKILGRTETRTRDRMCFQSIRTMCDISRDDRARIATCGLRTPTDRQTDLRRIIV